MSSENQLFWTRAGFIMGLNEENPEKCKMYNSWVKLDHTKSFSANFCYLGRDLDTAVS